jgi:hypothetical protein
MGIIPFTSWLRQTGVIGVMARSHPPRHSDATRQLRKGQAPALFENIHLFQKLIPIYSTENALTLFPASDDLTCVRRRIAVFMGEHERAALGTCDLSVLHVDGEWQWLVRQAGRDVTEGAARSAVDAQWQAEAVALELGRASNLDII